MIVFVYNIYYKKMKAEKVVVIKNVDKVEKLYRIVFEYIKGEKRSKRIVQVYGKIRSFVRILISQIQKRKVELEKWVERAKRYIDRMIERGELKITRSSMTGKFFSAFSEAETAGLI
jgi:hypothetical protein